MRLYKTTITPTSNFATVLKADTLFGQLCWGIKYALGEKRLQELLDDYEQNPFVVVSDAFVKDYLPKPNMPSRLLNEDSLQKKENRKKIWLTLEQLRDGLFNQALSDKDIKNKDASSTIVRNSINYQSFTTDGDGFDPYGQKEVYLEQKDVYFLLRDDFTLDELKQAFIMISKIGYGKKSSIGKGRFDIGKFEEVEACSQSSNTYMALAPFVAHELDCKEIYYEPFTRFGKSGAERAHKNAFKKPVVMADSGAVVIFETDKNIKYTGKGVKNISLHSDIVHQGYTPLLPIKGVHNE